MNTEWMAAIHEAGHAVACVRQGGIVTAIRISGRQGTVERSFYGLQDGQSYPTPLILKHDMAMAICTVAGPMAELHEFPNLRPAQIYEGTGADDATIERIFRNVGDLFGNDFSRFLRAMQTKARKILDAHWSEVVNVAEALFREKSLTGEQVNRIMVQTGQQPIHVLTYGELSTS